MLALISGASRGIGAACALALAKEGCDIIINFKRITNSFDVEVFNKICFRTHSVIFKDSAFWFFFMSV